MSIRSYVLKVSLPTKEQLNAAEGCTWENVSIKTGLSKVPWHPTYKSFPCFEPLEDYGIKAMLPRDAINMKNVCEAYNINPDEICDCKADLIGFTLIIGNGKNTTQKRFTYKELRRFRGISADSVLLLNEEFIGKWKNNAAVIDYFAKNYAVKDDSYLEITMKDLEYLKSILDPTLKIPTVREDEGLFYLQFR